MYRPEEHIDNPKDYADNVDATQYDPRLRGPVDPQELLVDPRTGMKNYIANEQGTWMTSAAYIRQSLRQAIECGRDHKMHEALRLLGQSLHTLEDLGAHSNWLELALIELGYDVFPHVGTATQINIQGKTIWPLVTGTFGGTDFIHSLLGEATDKISQTSLADLHAAVDEADMQKATAMVSKLKVLLKLVPTASNNLDQLQEAGQSMSQYHLQGTQGPGMALTAEEIAQKIYPILQLRDMIMKTIANAIEMVPGLSETIDEITTALNVLVLSIVQPFIRPIMRLVSENVTKSTALVMSDAAQYLVWNDPHSSDPTHSMLSKDHFSCYLNDPAGCLAKVIVRHTVTQVVAAWSDASRDPECAIDSILSCFCHPSLLNHSWQLHRDMFAVVKDWVEQIPPEKKTRILQGLTSEGVRRGQHHDSERRAAVSEASISEERGISAQFTTGVSQFTEPAVPQFTDRAISSTLQSDQFRTSEPIQPSDQFRQWPYNLDYNRSQEDPYEIARQATSSYASSSQYRPYSPTASHRPANIYTSCEPQTPLNPYEPRDMRQTPVRLEYPVRSQYDGYGVTRDVLPFVRGSLRMIILIINLNLSLNNLISFVSFCLPPPLARSKSIENPSCL